jgi:hypothetical protein
MLELQPLPGGPGSSAELQERAVSSQELRSSQEWVSKLGASLHAIFVPFLCTPHCS